MDKACIPGDVDNGEKLFKARCTQCHTINKVTTQTDHKLRDRAVNS
jgi:cytochrome c2